MAKKNKNKNSEKDISKNTKKPKKPSKLVLLKEQIGEVQDKHLRLKAEFENFRRRKDKEISGFLQYSGENVIKSFLPVMDDINRLSVAINKENTQIDESISEGLTLVLNKIDKWLGDLDVKPFGEKGENLDPELHDAMMTNTDDNFKEDQILDVFEKGYRYKDRVIRHAKVIVNKK
ncbi:MAG: nucleotide exchange factor GrpE [Candidatus Marinimicrobia bacterium]|jgi:molecular chaperone GrpE|nr:nucleotide exchange factor GrpE [Candidatus Neomarinimicrobiota bacterium]MBT3937098.1 nucleotide exchange factor GrpE [Candidatus Neomarinimicrobiota bacterium]MBT3962068.1 nucleotide exchange factor GrpE [Candidatus Neomarinimicrobiota bacterium]MBT4382436.1 nucleotide exchange factor GrpE [Candidatus Neomarinimicrobiota bacterium]MBT4636553.1 nucleotide exchange factor GrpE [Candidatus Neomarinimicrobiota bacterium]